MKIHIASDHAGVELKKKLVEHLKKNYEVIDHGPTTTDSVDYPDYAHKLCLQIPKEDSETFGILICGSGQGMAMTANKHPHIRAALCYNPEVTKLSREHNGANVLCMGARFLSETEAFVLTDVFLSTPFAGGRHQNRVAKIHSLPC